MDTSDDARRATEEILGALDNSGGQTKLGPARAELRELALKGAPTLSAAWLCSDVIQVADKVASHLGGLGQLSPGLLEARSRCLFDSSTLTLPLAELFDALASLAESPDPPNVSVPQRPRALGRARRLEALLSLLPESAQAPTRAVIEAREMERSAQDGSASGGSGSRSL